MTNTNHGGGPADGHDFEQGLDVQWSNLEDALAAYLSTMVDTAQGDHLILGVPGGDESEGAAPYVQFAAFGEGRMLRAEAVSNCYLTAPFQINPAEVEALTVIGGWQGGEEDNFFLERPVAEADQLAEAAIFALRSVYAVPAPGLLTVQAWGPSAAGAGVLGLPLRDASTDDSRHLEYVEPPAGWATSQVAVVPENHAELVGFIRDVLAEMFDPIPELDDDGDFVIVHRGQPVWVRARKDVPVVEIMARVAHDVRSRRATSVELGLLNRDQAWVKWTLRERSVWQTLLLPGRPFVAEHVRAMLEIFLDALGETRDDLVVRTGGRTA